MSLDPGLLDYLDGDLGGGGGRGQCLGGHHVGLRLAMIEATDAVEKAVGAEGGRELECASRIEIAEGWRGRGEGEGSNARQGGTLDAPGGGIVVVHVVDGGELACVGVGQAAWAPSRLGNARSGQGGRGRAVAGPGEGRGRGEEG